MNDGASVHVDEAYLRESITNPGARVVKGYQPIMPAQQLSAPRWRSWSITSRRSGGRRRQ